MAKIILSELAAIVGGELVGGGDAGERLIRGAAPLESAGRFEVSFLANKRYERQLAGTRAAAVIVAADYAGPGPDDSALIRCEDPYFAYREAMVALYGFRQPEFAGLDDRACVDPSARLAEGVRVGPFATITAGCTIGENTTIYPGVYVGPGCRIGRDCTIYPNVTLYDGTILHDRVTIHAGSSIGHDGFGYATHAGRHEKIPQAGWVELEDDVEIGACCAIDRATMGPTIVGAGTKFSNLVAIGHGAKMGKHCLLVAQVGVAGSATVGDYCVFGGQAGVAGHIRIGDGVRAAGRSGIIGDVAAGVEVGGMPAMPLAQTRRVWAATSRLPKLRNEVRKLTREVAELKRQLEMHADGQDSGGQENDR